MALTTTVVTVVVAILLTIATGQTLVRSAETVNSFARCETVVKEIEQEDRATVVDDSPTRLYFTWLSQECEVRAGPEYIIRKYTFFNNGTFLLLRHHYAEESCSIATHTVVIRGSIELLGLSTVVSGATETRFHVDTVNVIPLNRQVAHKFGRRVNLTCGHQLRWRPYISQLIYEQPREYSATRQLWYGPVYNSLQVHSPTKKRLGMNCLESFAIEFDELRLLRVQKRSSGDTSCHGSRFELFLGSVAPNVHTRWIYKTSSLQPTVLIRADTTNGCPICGSISRATEFSPPLLHEVAALPAFIGGYWLSERCESSEGGIWSKRRFQIYSGDKLWTGRWDYYNDPLCSTFLYAVTAAGSYVQRAGRQRRHDDLDEETFLDYFRTYNTSMKSLLKRSASDRSFQNDPRQNASDQSFSLGYKKDSRISLKIITKKTEENMRDDNKVKRSRRSLTDHVYRLLQNAQFSTIQSRFAVMMRGHQAEEITTKKPVFWSAPSGTTELDLHIAESILIPGAAAVAIRCGADRVDVLLTSWPRNCVPRIIEAPSTLGLRAKLGVNWNGQYIILLGLRDDNVWEAPLRQCAQIPPHNSILRTHLRTSVGLRFGLLSSASTNKISIWLLLLQLLWCLHHLVR